MSVNSLYLQQLFWGILFIMAVFLKLQWYSVDSLSQCSAQPPRHLPTMPTAITGLQIHGQDDLMDGLLL